MKTLCPSKEAEKTEKNKVGFGKKKIVGKLMNAHNI